MVQRVRETSGDSGVSGVVATSARGVNSSSPSPSLSPIPSFSTAVVSSSKTSGSDIRAGGAGGEGEKLLVDTGRGIGSDIEMTSTLTSSQAITSSTSDNATTTQRNVAGNNGSFGLSNASDLSSATEVLISLLTQY